MSEGAFVWQEPWAKV